MATLTGDKDFDKRITTKYITSRPRQRPRGGRHLHFHRRQRPTRQQLDEISRLFGDFDSKGGETWISQQS